MIGIDLRVKQEEGISPAHAEAYGHWIVETPLTKEEYERFEKELERAKLTAKQIYLQTNGIKEES